MRYRFQRVSQVGLSGEPALRRGSECSDVGIPTCGRERRDAGLGRGRRCSWAEAPADPPCPPKLDDPSELS